MKKISARKKACIVVNGLLTIVLIFLLSMLAISFNQPMSFTKVIDIIGFLVISAIFAFMFVPANILTKVELDRLKIE
jgi:quinol-cytochrome oxidoreductase complex cytochrome b subunit